MQKWNLPVFLLFYEGFLFKNSPKNLDSSNKTDLDFGTA